MVCLTAVSFLALADLWDVATKVLAAVAVITGPVSVVLLTRRGNRVDRVTVERTEVEKLYIGGTQELIKTLQGELLARTTELAAAKRKLSVAQEELDTSNRSMSSFQEQYRRLLELLRGAGVSIPLDVDPKS